MKEFKDFKYWDLKAKCKKEGLDSKGNREVLEKRLSKHLMGGDSVPQASQPTTSPPPPVQSHQDTPLSSPVEYVYEPKDYSEFLSEERLQRLRNQIAPIAAARGTFEFKIDDIKQEYYVEFRGGQLIHQSTTLIDKDVRIIKAARSFFLSRWAAGKDGARTEV